MMDDPAVGTYVFWTGAAHADDEFVPLGGAVIDCFVSDDGEPMVKVVEAWRRQIRYHTFPRGECEYGASGPNVRRDILSELLVQIGIDEVTKKKPFAHVHARTVLTGVCQPDF